ncbi:hypothetical protein CARUB_v10025081mg [Capsella rubella]|uniref:Uncharacterized protein n=1 Tax=Capsella rubella TaxID=81985 RepID=R0G0A0_9BRAS|nr:hypothetical protein CARUB_v10025081mg [Capsella rubella]
MNIKKGVYASLESAFEPLHLLEFVKATKAWNGEKDKISLIEFDGGYDAVGSKMEL